MHVLLTEDQELFRRTVREFAAREIAPVAAEHDENETFPKSNVKKMGALGLLGLTVPVEFKGAGGGPVEYALAIEEIARADAAHAVILSVNVSLVCEPILKYGTDEQKRELLPKLATGDAIGAFCLSEPQSGSDARNMQTRAVRDGDYYVLNGTKNWISNGGEAGIYLVFARLEGEEDRSAAFLVDWWRFGIRAGAKERKLGIRASATTQLFLEDCRVPVANRLGEEGQGFKIAMSSLDAGRIGVAAQALGIAQAAYDAAVEYAKQRQAFGQVISEFQGIQWMLADMHVRIEQARLLVYQAAVLESRGLPFAKESAMAKLAASETAMWVTTKAIQIHGGYGYSREYPVQRYFRDAKITEIYEGTSEIQRMVIARHILRPPRPAADEAPAEIRETATPVLELEPTPEELVKLRGPKKLHHVAVAVDSVDEALKYYRDVLGLDDIEVLTLEDRGLKVGLVKAGPSEVELLEPLNEDSTVGRFLDRRGPGLHHICFEVDDIEKSMRHFEGRGAEFLDPVPRPGAVGLVAFMPPALADGVLVEFAQTCGYELPKPVEEVVVSEADEEGLALPDAIVEAPLHAVDRPAGTVAYTRHGLWAQAPLAPVQPTAPAAPTGAWPGAAAPVSATAPTEGPDDAVTGPDVSGATDADGVPAAPAEVPGDATAAESVEISADAAPLPDAIATSRDPDGGHGVGDAVDDAGSLTADAPNPDAGLPGAPGPGSGSPGAPGPGSGSPGAPGPAVR